MANFSQSAFSDDDNCSLKKCNSIKRIRYVLDYYQLINSDENNKNNEYTLQQLLSEYIVNNNYQNLINDYHHLLTKHLNTPNPITNAANYQFINESLGESINCNIIGCKLYERNGRDRQEKSKETETGHSQNNEKNDSLGLYYMNFLDNIHAFFIHGYDTGFRIKIDANNNNNTQDNNKKKIILNNINNNNDDDKEDGFDENRFILDEEMSKLKMYQKKARSELVNNRGLERVKNNKFVTKIGDQKEDDDDDEKDDNKSNMNEFEYSFGHKYYYWPFYKDLNESDPNNVGYKYSDWYINKKYKSLKDEILNELHITLYDETVYKAKELIKTNALKTKKTTKIHNRCGYLEYDIPQKTPLKYDNLMSVLFYTDYTKLSYQFSLTFRKTQKNETDENMKKRNSVFWNWSKKLRETVELFGECMTRNGKGTMYTEGTQPAIPILYHGLSKMMIFNCFVSRFCSPTSMTRQIAVASMFSDGGVILEIEQCHANYPRYFNCSLLSNFGSEDERLFIGGSTGDGNWCDDWGYLQIHSVRIIKKNENYSIYVAALTIFDSFVKGKAVDVKLYTKNINWYFEIIAKMTEDKISNVYVQKLFKAFKKNVKKIHVKFFYFYGGWKCYGTKCCKLYLSSSDKCERLLLFGKIATIFYNVTEIQWEMRFVVDRNWVNSEFTSIYFDNLLAMIRNINNNKQNISLKTITITCIEYKNEDLKHYQAIFNQQGWDIKARKESEWDRGITLNVRQ